jgi:hypothetical protein
MMQWLLGICIICSTSLVTKSVFEVISALNPPFASAQLKLPLNTAAFSVLLLFGMHAPWQRLTP